MIDALVSFVVEELGAIVKDEVRLLAGVKKELKSLSSEFSAIQALLADAQSQQNTTEGVRDWLVKIKEVAYEVEDILDEWRTDAFTSQQDEDDTAKIHEVHSCLLFPCLCFKQVKSRHNIGHRIKEVRDRLNEISEEKSKFNLKEVNMGKGMAGLKEVNMGKGMAGLSKEERETSSLIDESEIFGRDEFKEKIIRQLVTETGQKEKPISIVSIVGMGGLGKTAIAQLVHNDARVKAYFANRVWVCVSDPFDVNKIATKVIKSLDASAPDNLDLDTTHLNLSKAVGEKPFLLVLDDVWDESGVLWQKLRLPLKGAAPGSGIVVTTRSRPVAEKMETTYIHDLGVLSNSDGWKLFKSIAFKGTEDEECQELTEIGEEIVERCKGVPLAIRALGSLLHSNRKRWYWKHVSESEIWDWDIPMDDGILPALLLSYYNLPPCLQRCFSFCSVFSKDEEIEKDELVKLWMANGIIKPKKAKKDVTEEIGEMYFDYLLTRSLFQDAERDIDGNVVRCKMHDLVHDLATFVSSGDHCSMEAGVSELCSIKCHHLSLLVKDDVSSIPSLLCKVERLHTLLLFGYSNIQAVLDTLFNPLRYLRALDLRVTSIENLPSFIGKLKHLRYLNLCRLKIVELPESVTDLCNLHTLKLNECRDLRTLPRSMSKMVKLRHLEIEGTTNLTVLPNGLGRLTSLRTLCEFPVGDENGGCKIGELKELNLLRGKLEIKNLEKVMNVTDASEAKLHMKSDLHVLYLSCNDKSDEEWTMLGDDEMKRMDGILEGLRPPHSNLKELKIKNYAGSKFPSWLQDSKFSSLVKVVLENCRKCILLPGLGELHSLKYLEIIGADEVVDGWFYGNADARTREYGEVMPFLEKLKIKDCKKLKATLECLPTTLTEVTIENCNEVIWAQDNPLPHLLHLTLKNVRGMSSNPLLYLPALMTLQIHGFSCESLPSDGWGLLESLHILKIQSCEQLSSLPEGLGQLKALQTLSIQNCEQLSSLPEGLGQLKALQTLSIQSCEQLSSLPEGLGQLEALQTLSIQTCEQLSSLPEGLGQLQALQTLSIQSCKQLSSLPEGIRQLEALQTLNIWNCQQLSSLPEGLGQLKALQTLIILNCEQLSSLPEGLGQLKVLQTLSISYCERLSSLPEGLGQLEALQTLMILNCKRLSSVPRGLGHLEALQTLRIDKCKRLSSLPEGLGQLKALQTLHIMDCKRLSSLPEGEGQLEALQTLHIQNCEILSSLPKGLGQLKALQTLHIQNCKILSSLPEELGQLKALQTLRIWGCEQLSSLFDGFEQLKSLRRLDIWDCPQLRPLPNLQLLTALERLSIQRCPLLTERLEKEKGEDWCKISHIPRISIDDDKEYVRYTQNLKYWKLHGRFS